MTEETKARVSQEAYEKDPRDLEYTFNGVNLGLMGK